MNARQRRRQRRKLKSLKERNAYALLGGKITKVEMLDKPPLPQKRDSITFDGSTLKEIPQAHTEDADISDEMITSLIRGFAKIFGTR